MSEPIFDSSRVYDDADEELDLIAPKSKRAQWRHRRGGPTFLKWGRRVKYRGVDLNAWVEHTVVETEVGAS